MFFSIWLSSIVYILAAFDILTLVTGNMKENGYEEIKRSKSLGDGLPQSRQRREERWRRRVSGFIQSAVGALKPEPAVESSQVSVTAVPCNHIRPGQTHNWHDCLFIQNAMVSCSKKTNPAGSVEQTYMMPSQCSSTWSFLGGIYLNMLSQHRVGPKKHWDGSNITPHPDSPRHSNVPPSRYSAASLLLSLLLISSLANAAPKSRSSKLKVSIILGWMHNTVHCWYC